MLISFMETEAACRLNCTNQPIIFFNNDLTPREAIEGKHASIFDRHGYRTENGERVKLTSHQARHLLNTIAQRGGLSNLKLPSGLDGQT